MQTPQETSCEFLLQYGPSNPADPSALLRLLECSNRTDIAEAIKKVYASIEETDRRQLPTLYTVISMYSVLLLLGAAGNALVIWIVLCNRRMRTGRNMYIANLAVSDLVLCTFTQPLNIVRLFQRYNGWQFGLALCKLVNTLTGINVFVSTYAIIAIAFDRFQVINRVGWRPDDKHRRRRTASWIAAVWLLACALSAPLAWFATITETHMPHDSRLHPLCTELTTDRALKAWKLVYSGVALLFQYLVPLCAVSIAYGLLCRRLNQKVRQRHQAPALITDYQRRRARVEKRRGRRANLLLAAIAVAFAIAWLPLTVTNVYHDIVDMRVGVGGNSTFFSAEEAEEKQAEEGGVRDESQHHLPMLLNLQGYGQADGGAVGGGGSGGGGGGGGAGSGGRALVAEFAPLQLILLPACLNPFLYGFLNSAFRDEFRRAFACLGIGGGGGGGDGGDGGDGEGDPGTAAAVTTRHRQSDPDGSCEDTPRGGVELAGRQGGELEGGEVIDPDREGDSEGEEEELVELPMQVLTSSV